MELYRNEQEEIFENLKNISTFFPAPMYWATIDNIILGVNKHGLDIFELPLDNCPIGKTPYDLYPSSMADKIVQHDNEVMRTGKTLVQEESSKGFDGKTWRFSAVKAPIRDEAGNIIGLIGTSVELSNGREKLLQELKKITDLIPTPVYWVAPDSTILGVNKYGLKTIGMSHDDFIHKTPYDLYSKEMADKIVRHNNLVMETEAILSQEETITDAHGQIKHFVAIKSPLKDATGHIIGLIGTSVEVTAQKEAEQRELQAEKAAALLKLESDRQQIALQEKENFALLARKVAHDISSPLAALKTIADRCDELVENKRSLLKSATESILDIANNLIRNYHKEDNSTTSTEVEQRHPLLVSDQIIQLLSEKRAQYQQLSIRFETIIADNAQFAFINVQKTEFRRALSNLINNAVDALEDKVNGTVTVILSVDANAVHVGVKDNGKGIPRDRVEKMLEHKSFTVGKKNGHGLGLQQIWDTLESNQGTMTVQSTVGEDTLIQLIFSRTAAPSWIAQEIHLASNNIIIILDDEESIHTAWNLRFADFLNRYPTLKSYHFTLGQDVLNFFDTLSHHERTRVFVLSDYELLNQDRNGLEIIEASQITGAVLVTSYYFNAKIREVAAKLGVKILPKQMASIIPIDVEVAATFNSTSPHSGNSVG